MIRLAAPLQPDSIVDGPGLRAVIWTQGCAHNCKGCHNPCTHDFKGGALINIEDIKEEISALEYHTGITFSGGDPMFQPKACAEIASYAKSLGLNIWCYTGFTFEKLISLNNPYINKFLENIDILVDGPFILEQRNLNLLFRGSENQRLIDVQKTLKNGEITLMNEYTYTIENLSEKEFKKSPLII